MKIPALPHADYSLFLERQIDAKSDLASSVRSTKLKWISLLALAFATATSQSQVLTRHVRPEVMSAQQVGRLPASQTLGLDLVLPLNNQAGLERFLEDVQDRRSSSFHHFLTVQEFTEQFGPSAADYEAVVDFAKKNHLDVVGGSRDAMEVQVKAPVAAVEAAFHVTMKTYKHPTEDRTFYSTDREPTPSSGVPIWHIAGLNNFSIPQPLYVKGSDYAKTHGLNSNTLISHALTGSGTGGSYLGSDMRSAYYGGTALTGAGQNMGLLEFQSTNLQDLNNYLTTSHQTNKVPITLFSADGSSTACNISSGCNDSEPTLDITQAIGMAPGLANLTLYIGLDENAAAIPVLSAMTTHNPLPTTIGCSWFWTPDDISEDNPYFQRMAAQGQTFFAASGDNATWATTNVTYPQESPLVISVGGTDLTTSSAGGAWQSETAWVDSGGGISPDNLPIPSWQQIQGVITSSNGGSRSLRNGPDVAADANFTFLGCFNQASCQTDFGGTSFAAPMWAAYAALVNQQLATQGDPPIGFFNPTIYEQNVTPSYGANFHDITSGTAGSHSAVTGYDLVTGWGTPNKGLLNALTSSSKPAATTVFNNKLYIFYQANDVGHNLWVANSTDGVNFTQTSIPSIQLGSAPAVAVLNGKLYLAYRSNDSKHTLWVASTTDGINFTQTNPAGIQLNNAPALTVFNNRLYLAYEALDSSHNLWLASSTDGINFAQIHPDGIEVGNTPALTVFNNKLYLAYESNDLMQNLWLASSTDGTDFTQTTISGTEIGSAPAMTVFNAKLYLSYQAEDASHNLWVAASADGVSFTQTHPTGIEIGSAPAMTVFNAKLYIPYQANDAGHILWLASSSNGTTFTQENFPAIQIGQLPINTFGDSLYASFSPANDTDRTATHHPGL